MIKARCTIYGVREFSQRLKKLDDATAGKALLRAANAGASIIRDEAALRAPKRTRTLARSIHVQTLESKRDLVRVAIGTNLEYAAIHEFGGVIKPVKGKLLAIPIDAAARAAGSPRGQDLVFVQTGGGQMFLMDKTGNPRYWLTGSVTIPARPYLRPAFDTKKAEAVKEMAAVLKRLLEAALK